MGAVVSQQQLDTINEYVEEAKSEGADVYHAPVKVPEKGFFYPPTLITNVQTVSRVVREEVGLSDKLFFWDFFLV